MSKRVENSTVVWNATSGRHVNQFQKGRRRLLWGGGLALLLVAPVLVLGAISAQPVAASSFSEALLDSAVLNMAQAQGCYRVPDLSGMTEAEAQASIDAINALYPTSWQLSVVGYDYSTTVPPVDVGLILSQYPLPGIAPNCTPTQLTVEVRLSLGEQTITRPIANLTPGYQKLDSMNSTATLYAGGSVDCLGDR